MKVRLLLMPCDRSRGCGGAKTMQVIFILWLREVKKYTRSRTQIIASLGSPIMYLGILGFGLGPIFQKAGQGSYLQFMAPGVIGMTVLFTSMFSGIALLWDRQFGFLKETLVAPVPRLWIMLGRTLGGATVAVAQGIVLLLIAFAAGFRVHDWLSLPVAIVFMALIAVMFTALGTAIASVLSDFQGFQFIMNLLIMPIFFLSGAMFPLANLPKALAIVTTLDPLSYGVDGLRHSLIGVAHFGLTTDFAVLSISAALLLVAASYLFSRIQL